MGTMDNAMNDLLKKMSVDKTTGMMDLPTSPVSRSRNTAADAVNAAAAAINLAAAIGRNSHRPPVQEVVIRRERVVRRIVTTPSPNVMQVDIPKHSDYISYSDRKAAERLLDKHITLNGSKWYEVDLTYVQQNYCRERDYFVIGAWLDHDYFIIEFSRTQYHERYYA
jgi:hypothetical protein